MEQGLLTDLYYDEILKVINEIRATERENILKAARMIADQVKQDKLVYVFGPGCHSNLAAMEVFFRAGGLMHISAILNQETMLSSGALKSMQTERLPGYGKIVVEDYGIGEGDLLWIVNAYGINSATIDAALTAKAHGAKVIGVDVDQAGVIAKYAAGEGADQATIDGFKALTVTSAMKGLYPATFDTLTDVIVKGNWDNYKGKIQNLGLVSGDDPTLNYVQIPMESTQWKDGAFTQDNYKAMVKEMFDGKITVSNDTTKAAKDFATVITVDDQGKIKG